jgi:predicted ATPase
LATLTEAELLLPTVADTLGVRESGEQPLKEILKDYLHERRLLLLLDNFEQVLGAAPTITGLLAGAPGLNVLATSRAPLGLYGEKEYAVPPLSVPDVSHLPDLKTLSVRGGETLHREGEVGESGLRGYRRECPCCC